MEINSESNGEVETVVKKLKVASNKAIKQHTSQVDRAKALDDRAKEDAKFIEDSLLDLQNIINSRPSATPFQYGETLIAYESPMNLTPFTLTPNTNFANRFGTFPHASMIGKKNGSYVYARRSNMNPKSAAYVDQPYLLLVRPTPEIWTHALLHRTQILYFADIAMICMELNLCNGAVVFESGTGSGSLSVSMARAVAPLGHLHTFEFHAERAQKARDDFALLQLQSDITVHHRNVVTNGFPRVEGDADAVFLDLPTPWTVVPMAKKVLKDGGRICCFSPCIEQVQRNCESLAEHSFDEIKTVEFIMRDWDVGTVNFSTPPFQIMETLLDNGKIKPESKHKSKKRRLNDDELNSTEDGKSVTFGSNIRHAYSALRPFANYRAHTGYLTFATCWHHSDDDIVSTST